MKYILAKSLVAIMFLNIVCSTTIMSPMNAHADDNMYSQTQDDTESENMERCCNQPEESEANIQLNKDGEEQEAKADALIPKCLDMDCHDLNKYESNTGTSPPPSSPTLVKSVIRLE